MAESMISRKPAKNGSVPRANWIGQLGSDVSGGTYLHHGGRPTG